MIAGAQVICVAPNGARRGKIDHPALPITADELARCAERCLVAGASAIHVHVRDDDGCHVLDAGRYIAATRAIRMAVGQEMVIQITTEAVGRYAPAWQMQLVRDVAPEAVSIALREILPDPGDDEARATLSDFLVGLVQNETMPQIILYTPEEVDLLAQLIDEGIFPWPVDILPILFVLGRYGTGAPSTAVDLLPFVAPSRPVFANWSICAFGQNEAACTTVGLALGGSARVGFENNPMLPDGSVAAENAVLVSNLALAAQVIGVPLASAEDLRSAWRRKLAGLSDA